MMTKSKSLIQKRLKLIEGQVRGLQKMIAEEKYCVDVIFQSMAVKKALLGVENLILRNHLTTHVVEQIKSGRTAKAVEEISKIYKLSGNK